MFVERQNQDVVIRLNASLIDIREIQRFVDYVGFLESNAKNQGSEEEATQLARETDFTWWQANKHRFLP